MELRTIDLVDPTGRKRFLTGIDRKLRERGMTDSNKETFLDRAVRRGCPDRRINDLMASHSPDRLACWSTGGRIAFCDEGGLSPEDLPYVAEHLPRHLDECDACMAHAFGYAEHVEAAGHLLDMVAAECLELELKETALTAEASQGRYEELVRATYALLIDVERTRLLEEKALRLESLTCIDPEAVKPAEEYGLRDFSSILPLSDSQVAKEYPEMAMTREERLSLLRELSEHIAACAHCALLYELEKEAERQLEACVARICPIAARKSACDKPFGYGLTPLAIPNA